MTTDPYADAGPSWAAGAELVYGPIADALVDTFPHPVAGRVVLDVGAGTGAVSRALSACGARPIAADLSHGMLAWHAAARPKFPAILLWLLSGLLMAIATVRARLLPIPVGIGFAIGLPATMAVGHAGPMVFGVLWIAVAAMLPRNR